MVGAMASWNVKADVRQTLTQSLSIHAFGDRTGKTGQAFYDLGDVYRSFKRRSYNSSIPFQVLFWSDQAEIWKDVEPDQFDEMDRRLKKIAESLEGAEATSPDAEIVQKELGHVQNLLKLSAEFGRYKLGGPKPERLSSKIAAIKKEHERVWLLRNRSGGLADSTARLKI
jgi:hypothetical protein